MSFLPSFLLDAATTTAADATCKEHETTHDNVTTTKTCTPSQPRAKSKSEDGEDDEPVLRRKDQRGPLPPPPTSLTMPPPAPLQPPLGVTGIMCHEGKATLRRGGTVCYRIFRPRYLTCHQSNYQPPTKPASSSSRAFVPPVPPPPLVVLQGGPGMPCPYLFPLAHVVTDRAIVFYDPLGCGSSVHHNHTTTTASATDCFALTNMVQDLKELIQDHWKLCRFHLYGHSFGGILAFEYLLQQQQQQQQQSLSTSGANACSGCQSVILASTPTSTDLVESESLRLLQQLQQDHQPQQAPESSKLLELFRQKHECRIQPPPLAILDACWHAANLLKRQGHLQRQQQHEQDQQEQEEQAAAAAAALHVDASVVSNGTEVTGDTISKSTETANSPTKPPSATTPTALYSYTVPSMTDSSCQVNVSLPPALVVWGQYDFVTERCVDHWNDYNFASIQMTLLANCSHYGMWEEETLYGNVLASFLRENDEPNQAPTTLRRTS